MEILKGLLSTSNEARPEKFSRRVCCAMLAGGFATFYGFKKTFFVNRDEIQEGTYEEISRALPPTAPAIVDVQIFAPETLLQNNNLVKAEWGEHNVMDQINKSMRRSGELRKIDFSTSMGFLRWRYEFKSLEAREKWAKQISQNALVKIHTFQRFSLCRDGNGGTYLYEKNVGMA
jgi:hypothetical protein